MNSIDRRQALKIFGTASAGSAVSASRQAHAQDSADDASTLTHQSRWDRTHDRVFLGGDYWANPMEDWRIRDGAAECQSTGGGRNIQLLTHQLTDPQQSFHLTVAVERVQVAGQDGGAGFRIGIHSELDEYRSNLFAKSGIIAGVRDGNLILNKSETKLPDPSIAKVNLRLLGRPGGDQVELTLQAFSDFDTAPLAEVSDNVDADAVKGNIALANNFNFALKKNQGARYRFSGWSVGGDAFTVRPERAFGPILWSMYSLSDSRGDDGWVMKLTALTGPMGESDAQDVELRVNRNGSWETLGTQSLDSDAWTATFRVANWDESQATPYELVYRERLTDGSESESRWSGNIKANPSGRPLRVAALTCQNDYGFPYEPVCDNLVKLDPDLLYFSGDQLYEGHGGFGLIRRPAEPAILNYLRKYYQHGIAFRDAMKNAPTICLADDHDVFQGNIWGEAGKPMDIDAGGTSSNGGYIEPARMVNVVHRTNTSHHPDFYDPTPVKQGISVYYGDMVYGGVSFAILADRQWKSGPQNVDTGSGRADHVVDPEIDPKRFDQPGLVLLGQRQEEFLKDWANDWRGHTMKVVLSQTVLAGVATHHGGYDGYLVADLDCGGWPQTPRDRAVKLISAAKALHINGDQHLTTMVQYGVDQQRDSGWSFCTPAIAAGYPRWWRPDEVGMEHDNRPDHGLPHTGEFVDALGNRAYVYCVGNPEVGTKKNRYEKAHQKGSGFGLVTIDTKAKTYKCESFRFLIDATDDRPDNQFPGWPVTIEQRENAGDNRIG